MEPRVAASLGGVGGGANNRHEAWVIISREPERS